MPFWLEWNGVIPFLQEWSGHSILAGMEFSFHYCRNGMTPFHSSRNEMNAPFQTERTEQSIPGRMKWKFYAGQNQMLIPTQSVLSF